MIRTVKKMSAAFLMLAILITAVPLFTMQQANAAGTLQNVKISGNTLSWSKFSGAEDYVIQLGDEELDEYLPTKIVSASTTSVDLKKFAEDKGIFYSGTFRVSITARSSSQKNISQTWKGSWKYTTKGKMATPKNPYWNYGNAQWSAVKNTDKYLVKVYLKRESTYEYYDTFESKTNKLCLTNLPSGEPYAFTVTARRSGYTDSEESDMSPVTVRPDAPKVTNSQKGFKITWKKPDMFITWEKISDVKGYQVWRSEDNGETYIKAKTVEGGSTVKFVNTASAANKNGVKYKYKVRAYQTVNGKTCYTQFSKPTVCYKLTTPAAPSVSNTAAGLKVTWKKNGKADGYQIWRSDDGGKSFIKAKTVKGASATSFINTAAAANKNGKTYKYKIRSYKVVSGKTCYSAYSPIKTITRKM